MRAGGLPRLLLDLLDGLLDPVAELAQGEEAVGVGEVDGVVVGVGVAVELLGVVGVEEGVEGQEAAGFGVVGAGAELGEAGGVEGAADEAAGAGVTWIPAVRSWLSAWR